MRNSPLKQYVINIHKNDSEIINQRLFKPKIAKYIDKTCVCCYLNFPHNWANWHLPKYLHKKELRIAHFDITKIVIEY